MNRNLVVGTLVTVSMLAMPNAAFAEKHWRGDIGHFHERDGHHWAGGHWYHGPHDGRLGWWWVVGVAVGSALWYPYAAPVYPYPDPYVPPALIVAPAPAPSPQMMAPAPTPVWYYCTSRKNYYPYVSDCPEGWKTVPAAPANQ
jgi:hypothetical protein